jgi:site-specific recombinase XerD
MGNQRGRPLNFQDMNPAFFDTYIRYLVEDCGNAHNTVAKKLGFLKSFLNWAGKHKHAEKSVAEDLAVPTARKVAHVALTEAELTQMVATHLPDRLARVRDVFCFGCYTGLRFSDIAQLSQANFTHQGSTPALRLTVRKTKEPLVLPLAPQALAIWEHYAGALPVLSNQKTNAYLKEIGQQAGIDSPVQQVRHVGSRVDATTQPKFSLITTHTARRTFATLSAARGMNPIILQRILGHATLNQTLDYIKEIDGTAEMLKVWG